MAESGRPFLVDDLGALVDVVADGTLSKVVHHGDGVRLVLFAFDRDQELTEHTASVPASLQVLRGRLAVGVGEERIELVPGGYVHLPAKAPHSVRALEPTVLLITMISGPTS